LRFHLKKLREFNLPSTTYLFLQIRTPPKLSRIENLSSIFK